MSVEDNKSITASNTSEPNNKNISAASSAQDPEALVQEVLRESYLQTIEDLRLYAEKVKYFNQQKKALRSYLTSLREFRAKVISAARTRGVSLGSADKKDAAVVEELITKSAHAYDVGPVEYELSVPNRVPPVEMNTLTQVENEIERWETKLNSIGDDAQLANVDLQNILQKQQQALQMMSNISKMSHDTLMSIIRKIGG